MRVLVACEFSGIVREAFARRGNDAWSCDLLPTEIPGNLTPDLKLQGMADWKAIVLTTTLTQMIGCLVMRGERLNP